VATTVVCGTLFLLFGYDAGVLGGLLAYPPFLNAIGNPTDAWTIPMIASSYTLAACVVSPFVSTFAFYSGRRGCMILGCLLVIVGAVVQAASYSVGQMIAGRVIVGFGIGSISSSVPAYLAVRAMLRPSIFC
jgi:MFS family permease